MKGVQLLPSEIADIFLKIEFLAVLILFVVSIILFMIAFLWILLNRAIYRIRGKKGAKAEEPKEVTEQDINLFFQLTIEEIERRQRLDELIISSEDNIDHDKMEILRRQYNDNEKSFGVK
ncbi:hypothetical protein FZC66_18710 [Priestia megaterium]|nr:hypothetical protein FZC66_18710 [Priestia megaterium]